MPGFLSKIAWVLLTASVLVHTWSHIEAGKVCASLHTLPAARRSQLRVQLYVGRLDHR
jgi:hypothetical protein